MPFPFFENSINSGIAELPNERYRNLQQAFIDEQWDNTSAMTTILEQDMEDGEFVKGFTFHEVEAWLNYVVGMTSTGTKEGRDFVQLIFKDIDYPIIRGRYYQFEDCYWITDFTDTHNGLTGEISVRRCNNFLRIIDPENGEVFSIPCVVGYDMASPSFQTNTHIITPNNHATVMVQGNEDTMRLFKTNTRYILGGRPFKLSGYQNAIEYSLTRDMPTMLYLDLYLDEIHPNDDLVNQIADNESYEVVLDTSGIKTRVLNGASGTLSAKVMLNDFEVEREIEWRTSDPQVVTIDQQGNYSIVGEVGQSATITAVYAGDTDDVVFTIIPQSQDSVFVTPIFNKVAELDSLEFRVGAIIGGVSRFDLDDVEVSVDPQPHINITQNNGVYTLVGLKHTAKPQTIHIKVANTSPAFSGELDVDVVVSGIFG